MLSVTKMVISSNEIGDMRPTVKMTVEPFVAFNARKWHDYSKDNLEPFVAPFNSKQLETIRANMY